MRSKAYRYANEHLVLGITLLLVLVVIALTATATVCTSGLFVLAFVVISFTSGRAHHQALIQKARHITPATEPGLDGVVQEAARRLQPGKIDVFVVPAQELNAYTFGVLDPKVIVLYAPLFKVMDRDEISFIVGHEMGHIALGHTWLNSLVGGMAGIPSSVGSGFLLSMVFLSWNRICEFSADRAGLLACGNPEKAISALVKLEAGPDARTPADLQAAYRQIDAEDDTFSGVLSEALGTHPMLIRRVEELRRYAQSSAYQRLQVQLNHRLQT